MALLRTAFLSWKKNPKSGPRNARTLVDRVTTGDARPQAFYGIEKRHLVPGWPSTSPAHDPAYYLTVNSGGLAGPWRLWCERFTVGGRWFLAATVALFISGVNSLELQSYVPLLYAGVLWVAAFAAYFGSKPKARLRVAHSERVCAGETLSVEVQVINDGRRVGRDWVVLPHRLPPSIAIEPAQGAPLGPVPPLQSARAIVGLRCTQRGVYTLHGWRVETSFPFSLLSAATVSQNDERFLVFPSFTPLASLDITPGRRHHPGGVALASQLGESFEFLGNREYRDGDNPRDIDWRATARLQKPIVREYREEYFLRVAVVLDTHLKNPHEPQSRAAFERAVSLCAAVGDYMARQEYLVDIFAAGPNLYHLTAGRSLAYLDQILDILACVDPNPDEPFETVEPEIQENLAQINAIVCLFLDWNEARRAFCDRLARSGAGLKIIIVRDDDASDDPTTDTNWTGPITFVSKTDYQRGALNL